MALSVGEQLKAAREQRHLSLDAVANSTHIRPQFLKALEENHLDELSSKAQARGFIRLYASFLGIPFRPLLDALEEKPPVVEPSPIPETVESPSSTETTAETSESSGAKPSFAAEEMVAESPAAFESDYQIIYSEIGQQLRQRREALSLSLDDISLHTHLKKNVLEILEDGQFDSLPSPVQARGMLNNYATFLNLDVDNMLMRFAEALQLKRAIRPLPAARPLQRTRVSASISPVAATSSTILTAIKKRISTWSAALGKKLRPITDKIKASFSRIQPAKEEATPIAFPVKPAEREAEPMIAKVKLPPGWRHFVTPDLIVGAFLIILLFGFLFWTVTQLINWQASQSGATPSSVADILLATQTITETPGPANSPVATGSSAPTAASNGGIAVNATLAATLPSGPTLPVQIAIIANQRAYLDIKTDGNDKFTGNVLPGNAYEFGAYNTIELTSGNAAALRVIYNQQDMGILGNFGQDIHLIFTQKGVATPTPAAAPTATRTPTPTITVPATLTRQPTPTAPTPTVTPFVP
jgi:cytoskeletal protein RodZ